MTPKTLTLLSLAALLAACGDKDGADDTGASGVAAEDTSGEPAADDTSGGDTSGEVGGDDTAGEVASYACGWDAAAPSDLASTGSEIGDVIADFSAVDQCGDEYRIWDGYGTYTMILSVGFS